MNLRIRHKPTNRIGHKLRQRIERKPRQRIERKPRHRIRDKPRHRIRGRMNLQKRQDSLQDGSNITRLTTQQQARKLLSGDALRVLNVLACAQRACVCSTRYLYVVNIWQRNSLMLRGVSKRCAVSATSFMRSTLNIKISSRSWQ